MKIKKPVVGDIVICDGCPSIVYFVDESDATIVGVIKKVVGIKVNGIEGCRLKPFESKYSVLNQYHENIKYPDWKYPEQTDEMIEVSDV